ncbi:uncharacterized protein LOC131631751 [Vicia villosa]|uniref:uncharacterized protein LOC131631751 n=1 Tax=Vicia villosa TaxID=3911 RepID=UPI00273BDB5F|nr:uncharacterized protein LOC131631751 [Vicia villosa]
MNGLKNFMTKTWIFVQLPDMYYNEEGYFVLRFKYFNDRDDVLMKGPYSIHNVPVLIREWSPDFKLKDDFLRTLPIWVKFPQLPLYLWGEVSLNQFGSALGIPLVTDECTANHLQISYARILMEMDITQKLPTKVTIRDNDGNRLQQPIEYEWKPMYCKRCQKPGHNCDQAKPNTKQWKPKPKSPTGEKSELATEVLTEVPKAPTEGPKDTQVVETESIKTTKKAEEEQTWKEVSISGGDRGKIPMVTNSTDNLTCENGFDALHILNDLQVLQDIGQC